MRTHRCLGSVTFLSMAASCCLVLFILASESSAQQNLRTWSSPSGQFTVEAELVGRDGDSIRLKPESRDALTVNLTKLSLNDQKYVNGLDLIAHDQELYELLMPHRERYSESPLAVLDIVEELSKRHPESPYAAMMTGLAYASEQGDYSKAQKYFKKARQAVRDGQEALGAGYHARTMRSIENNLAVSMAKMRKEDAAAKYLVACAADTEIPFCIYHNATLLLEATRTAGSALKLNDQSHKKLIGLLARKAPASPGLNVPTRFLYSLEWDEPMDVADLERLIGRDGKPFDDAAAKGNAISGSVFSSEQQLEDRGYQPYCSGSGFLIAPNLLVTNRHVVQAKDNSLSYTITQYKTDGSPQLVGGRIIKWSVIDEEDLALVELDASIDATPLPVRSTDLVADEQITALGFPLIGERGEHLSATSGQFVKYDKDRPWHYSTAQLSQGNSGGPMIDMNGNVVGVAFAKRDYRNYKLIGAHWLEIRYSNKAVSVTNRAVRDFVGVAKEGFVFAPENKEPFSNRQKLVDRIRGSVMLVKSWKPPSAIVEEYATRHSSSSQLTNLAEMATLREQRLYPDLRCMTCDGKGYRDCPDRTCRKGGIPKKVRRQTGYNPTLDIPIYTSATEYDTCQICNGQGSEVCPHCDRGRLSLTDR